MAGQQATGEPRRAAEETACCCQDSPSGRPLSSGIPSLTPSEQWVSLPFASREGGGVAASKHDQFWDGHGSPAAKQGLCGI